MITAHSVIQNRHGSLAVTHHEGADGGTCIALSAGDLTQAGLLVRLHSSCLFGEAFGAWDCDCGQQLDAAFRKIAEAGSGVVTYTYEEGRGAGIAAKIEAMEVQQSNGITTYDAYSQLGLPWDNRDHDMAIIALSDLGVSRRISLMSNNPSKALALESAGFEIERHVQLSYAVNAMARDYLESKRDIGRHNLDLSRLIFGPS